MAINNIDIQDEKGNSYRPMANPDSISEFTKTATRTNIASGDTHRTIFGKICKFFADLGTSAFSGLANNLTTTAAGYGMDARQGPVIQQKFDQINSNLGGVKIIPEGSGAATKYYAQLGADATSKKLLGIELIKLGSEAGTYDLSSYTGWESFSGNNFLITSKAYAASASYGNNGRPFGTNTTSSEPVKTYENGILTVSESDTGEIWDSNKQYYIRAATIVTGVYLIY